MILINTYYLLIKDRAGRLIASLNCGVIRALGCTAVLRYWKTKCTVPLSWEVNRCPLRVKSTDLKTWGDSPRGRQPRQYHGLRCGALYIKCAPVNGCGIYQRAPSYLLKMACKASSKRRRTLGGVGHFTCFPWSFMVLTPWKRLATSWMYDFTL